MRKLIFTRIVLLSFVFGFISIGASSMAEEEEYVSCKRIGTTYAVRCCYTITGQCWIQGTEELFGTRVSQGSRELEGRLWSRIVTASAYDKHCAHHGQWEAEPYERIRRVLTWKARCSNGLAPTLHIKSDNCETSIITVTSTYTCQW